MPSEAVQADVALLLEGTYPFVRGGVSSWVHELIMGLPELRFSLVFLGAEKFGEGKPPQYDLPKNVVSLHKHFLMGEEEMPGSPCHGDAHFFEVNTALHDWFRNPIGPLGEWIFDTAVLQSGRSPETCLHEFFHSEAAWSEILRSYMQRCPDAPMLSYFWTVRNTHAPLIKLAGIARTIPAARMFHAVSTGYAGLLGAMLHRLTGRPLILTEHGIYTKERKIELLSLFLRERQGSLDAMPEDGLELHEQLWLRLFEGVGRLVYAAADPIISLYEQNRQRQIADGADAARTRIIPNGVHVERFAPLREKRPKAIPHVLGLIGRIVPIKDIKTFIRAVHVLSTMLPDVEGWLIGPEEEDATYVEECRELVRTLNVEKHIKFLGFRRIEEVLPRMGLMVLTSISEAFPLVIGESYASGLPVLTTDVGACRDIVEGRDAEDRALGSGGGIVPIADPDALAEAAYALLSDPARWYAAQEAGIRRVERYYRQSGVIAAYRDVYASTGGT